MLSILTVLYMFEVNSLCCVLEGKQSFVASVNFIMVIDGMYYFGVLRVYIGFAKLAILLGQYIKESGTERNTSIAQNR